MAPSIRSADAFRRIAIVIPARFASSRLPGKPLADILGKPMVQHVHERATEVGLASSVVVATDDERVARAVLAFGGVCVMTSPDHPSGTDRLTEVMHHVDADIYVNLQGDEPMVRSGDIVRLAEGMLADPSVAVGTLCHRLPAHEAANPNQVKVVLATNGDALYFSRAPIPFVRDGGADPTTTYMKHVGVYAYRRDTLAAYASLPTVMIEQAEKLEQLRLMAAGLRIRVFEIEPTGPGVDTPDCLERVRALMAGQTPVETATPVHTAVPVDPLARIRLVITDVDGVLTDGTLHYDASGECMKSFHVRDGLGMRLLEECGIRVAVLSGRDSAALRSRVADLRLTLCRFGVKDKAEACRSLMAEAGVSRDETACIGDDSIDLPAFGACGLTFAVPEAPDYVRRQAHRLLVTPGGRGAFRELADALLLAQGRADVIGTAAGFGSVMGGVSQ